MASTTVPNPRVGIAVIICNEKGELVMGKRAGSHGAGTWAFPGGHLEMGESFFECAERETLEETGLRVKGTNVLAVTNDVFDASSKHYITVFVQCIRQDTGAQPQIMEPNKCEGWEWISWEDIKKYSEHHDDAAPEWADKKCFLPIRNLTKENPAMDHWIARSKRAGDILISLVGNVAGD
ncbi:nudix domain-containing protein [Xylaria flabelliformis]|nr:nudix domain-containing protein [Xylaria flabelliformis]